jgi:hypothetical protein
LRSEQVSRQRKLSLIPQAFVHLRLGGDRSRATALPHLDRIDAKYKHCRSTFTFKT